jgi:hypothetical protein
MPEHIWKVLKTSADPSRQRRVEIELRKQIDDGRTAELRFAEAAVRDTPVERVGMLVEHRGGSERRIDKAEAVERVSFADVFNQPAWTGTKFDEVVKQDFGGGQGVQRLDVSRRDRRR